MEDIGEKRRRGGGICDRRHLRDSTIGIFWINGPGSLPLPLNLVQSATGEEVGVGKVIQEPNFRKLRLHLASATIIYATVD